MRKNRSIVAVCILVAMVFAVSCTTYMGRLNEDSPQQLSLSAIFTMGAGTNHVFVAWSRSEALYKVEDDLRVYCIVNGRNIYEGVEREVVGGSDRDFEFTFDFVPGDEVELVAEVPSAGIRASSKATSVEPIPVTSVDTVCVEVGYNNNRIYVAKMHFGSGIDRKVFLRALPLRGFLNTKDGADGPVMYSSSIDTLRWFRLDADVFKEPDLGIPKELCDMLEIPYKVSERSSFVFSNASFQGGDAFLPFDICSRDFMDFKSDMYYHELFIEPTICFRLGTMDEEVYHYFNSLDKILYWANTSGGLFNEPIILRNNIDGGVGFFGLVSTSTYTIRIPDYWPLKDCWK